MITLFSILSLKNPRTFIFFRYVSTYVVASDLSLVWENPKSSHPLAVYSRMFAYPWLRTRHLSPTHTPTPTPSAEFINWDVSPFIRVKLRIGMALQFHRQDFIHHLLNPGSWILCVALVMAGQRERDRCDYEFSSSIFSFHLFTTDRAVFWGFPCERSRIMALSRGHGWESAEGISSVCSIGLCRSVSQVAFRYILCTYKKDKCVVTLFPFIQIIHSMHLLYIFFMILAIFLYQYLEHRSPPPLS